MRFEIEGNPSTNNLSTQENNPVEHQGIEDLEMSLVSRHCNAESGFQYESPEKIAKMVDDLHLSSDDFWNIAIKTYLERGEKSDFERFRQLYLSNFTNEELIGIMIEKSGSEFTSAIDMVELVSPKIASKIRTDFEVFYEERGDFLRNQSQYIEAISEFEHINKGIEKNLRENRLELDKVKEYITSNKLDDIDRDGIAFSARSGGNSIEDVSNRLKKILKVGLLGASYKWPEIRWPEIEDATEKGKTHEVNTKETWAKNTRKYQDSAVYFNITGRMFGHSRNGSPLRYQIRYSHWVGGTVRNDVMIVLFNHNGYKEENPVSKTLAGPVAPNTYRGTNVYKEMKDGKVDAESGFILSHRVAPRKFTGLAFRLMSDAQSHILFMSKAKDYINAMIENSKGDYEKLLPIYDAYGNLHWPVYIPNNEIKKLMKDKIKEAHNFENPEKE